MLWSLAKILIFVLLVTGLTLGASAMMETGEGMRISVAGWEFTLAPLQTLILVIVLFLAVWLIIRLAGLLIAMFRFLNGDETAISRYFDRNRERKGYEALADGMLALASGEGQQALSKAARAERFLRRPELTDLLSAQAAELTGDGAKAQEVYKRLLANDRTRFVGVRGLLRQKLESGDTDLALKLAEKAFAIKPRHEETQDVLLRLQAEGEDWSGARTTLGAQLRYGALPRDVHRRRDAVLALSEARDIFAEGRDIEAREAAIEANRLSPDLVPAAVLAAQSYVADDKMKYAARVLRKAWAVEPHQDLAAGFAALAPDETPKERLTRFAPLLKAQPDHSESRMLSAELQIAAEDFPAARKALGELAETDPTARALTLMAAIERGEGADDAAVRGWLTKALTAARGPQWICDKCNSTHADWTPTCPSCAGFDTLSWRVAEDHGRAMPASTEMLPLIVGAPEVEDESPEETLVEDVRPVEEVLEVEVTPPSPDYVEDRSAD